MKRVFSGVQPTNNLHIGNYFGAIKNWIDIQDSCECLYCVVDLHAITVKQDPKALKENILTTAKTYLALGVDPRKSIVFVQSKIKEHAELAWILNTIAKISELERMTQFKDKSRQHRDNINMGLFDYPVLMAADILLYDTEAAPVGEDQIQHVELARALAKRFNNEYGDTFVAPEALVKKEGARIMGLDDPSKKMSKSAPNPASYIALLDTPETVAKKISRAVTDSGSEIKSGKNKPALTNLLTIHSLFSGQSVKELEKQFSGKGYADFKKDLAAVVSGFLGEFQEKYHSLKDEDVREILRAGESAAQKIAGKKMEVVKARLGLD